MRANHTEPPSGFVDFANANWARMVRTAMALGCRPSDAEDAAQDALTKAYVHWTKVSMARDPRAYVYRILVNSLKSRQRKRWSREHPRAEVADERFNPDDGTAELSLDVLDALRRLSDPQRAVIVLHYYLGLTVGEVADVLGVRPGTVKSRLSRAREQLSADPRIRGLAPLEGGADD